MYISSLITFISITTSYSLILTELFPLPNQSPLYFHVILGGSMSSIRVNYKSMAERLITGDQTLVSSYTTEENIYPASSNSTGYQFSGKARRFMNPLSIYYGIPMGPILCRLLEAITAAKSIEIMSCLQDSFPELYHSSSSYILSSHSSAVFSQFSQYRRRGKHSTVIYSQHFGQP